ncbi:hypothetical protein FISHEDRAFT_59969 [Fistulina hepatica ATCC 64428]|uniref:Uncharacterized protein n=1 Tax=Fistulina hepatica ATCC 64428 TaxID=1128425 RepID=A0A0D7A833_9AGAR|nr:hypothetical protein FISHEDRAFT_59969 [Fistulina hepatica ATCC 64428]
MSRYTDVAPQMWRRVGIHKENGSVCSVCCLGNTGHVKRGPCAWMFAPNLYRTSPSSSGGCWRLQIRVSIKMMLALVTTWNCFIVFFVSLVPELVCVEIRRRNKTASEIENLKHGPSCLVFLAIVRRRVFRASRHAVASAQRSAPARGCL